MFRVSCLAGTPVKIRETVSCKEWGVMKRREEQWEWSGHFFNFPGKPVAGIFCDVYSRRIKLPQHYLVWISSISSIRGKVPLLWISANQ